GRPKAGGGSIGTIRGLRPRGRAEGPPLRLRRGLLSNFSYRDADGRTITKAGGSAMKIASVTSQLVSLPLLRGPWTDSIHHTTAIEIVVTDVTTDTGLVGTGRSEEH